MFMYSVPINSFSPLCLNCLAVCLCYSLAMFTVLPGLYFCYITLSPPLFIDALLAKCFVWIIQYLLLWKFRTVWNGLLSLFIYFSLILLFEEILKQYLDLLLSPKCSRLTWSVLAVKKNLFHVIRSKVFCRITRFSFHTNSLFIVEV